NASVEGGEAAIRGLSTPTPSMTSQDASIVDPRRAGDRVKLGAMQLLERAAGLLVTAAVLAAPRTAGATEYEPKGFYTPVGINLGGALHPAGTKGGFLF